MNCNDKVCANCNIRLGRHGCHNVCPDKMGYIPLCVDPECSRRWRRRVALEPVSRFRDSGKTRSPICDKNRNPAQYPIKE